MSSSRPLLEHVEPNPNRPRATGGPTLALLQKYVDISGYTRAPQLHEESLKRMFTNDQSAFTPSMELLLDTEVWVDDEAPEIIRPYCKRVAKLEGEPADTKSQEIRKQVKHLQRHCTNILLMASQLSKSTVMASAYTRKAEQGRVGQRCIPWLATRNSAGHM